MKEQFVTHEIALKLGELGFNEYCFAFFTSNKELINVEVNENEHLYSAFCRAPLWQQATDWLRDKYKLHIIIYTNKKAFVYQITTIPTTNTYGESSNRSINFNSHAAALENAILKIIKQIKL